MKKSSANLKNKEDDYETLIRSFLLEKYLALTTMNYLDNEYDSLYERENQEKERQKNKLIKRPSKFLSSTKPTIEITSEMSTSESKQKNCLSISPSGVKVSKFSSSLVSPQQSPNKLTVIKFNPGY